MVQKIVKYECEICGNSFSKKKKARKCEKRGKPAPFPIPTIFHGSGFYDDNITFVIVENRPERHVNYPLMWAARDNGYGDNFGDTYCGNSNFSVKDMRKDQKPRLDLPHFKRALKKTIESMKEENLNFTVEDIYFWSGERVVTYKEFVKLESDLLDIIKEIRGDENGSIL